MTEYTELERREEIKIPILPEQVFREVNEHYAQGREGHAERAKLRAREAQLLSVMASYDRQSRDLAEARALLIDTSNFPGKNVFRMAEWYDKRDAWLMRSKLEISQSAERKG